MFTDQEAGRAAPHGLWTTLAWFGGLLVGTALVGFVLAQGVFLLAFLRRRVGLGWPATLAYSAVALGFITAMAALLNRDFPAGLLQGAVELPWPLR